MRLNISANVTAFANYFLNRIFDEYINQAISNDTDFAKENFSFINFIVDIANVL